MLIIDAGDIIERHDHFGSKLKIHALGIGVRDCEWKIGSLRTGASVVSNQFTGNDKENDVSVLNDLKRLLVGESITSVSIDRTEFRAVIHFTNAVTVDIRLQSDDPITNPVSFLIDHELHFFEISPRGYLYEMRRELSRLN